MGMTPAGADAARLAADLIRIDTTNRGGGDARERPAAEYVAARLAEAGLEPVLLESAPGRANVGARGGGTRSAARGGSAAGGPPGARPAAAATRGSTRMPRKVPRRVPCCCTDISMWSRRIRRGGPCIRFPV